MRNFCRSHLSKLQQDTTVLVLVRATVMKQESILGRKHILHHSPLRDPWQDLFFLIYFIIIF